MTIQLNKHSDAESNVDRVNNDFSIDGIKQLQLVTLAYLCLNVDCMTIQMQIVDYGNKF